MSVQKNAGIKSLLLRAWRERWSDVQWSISIKKQLPPGGNGDSCQLADLLLQQALIGSSPNSLVLSYLKHALSSQMVTYSAAIRSVVKHTDMTKAYCVRGLLDVVDSFSGKISAKGTSEDSFVLAKSLLALLKWSVEIMQRSLQRLTEERNAQEYVPLAERACDLMKTLMDNQSSRALLYIARLEETELFRELEQTEANVRVTLGQMGTTNISTSLRDAMDSSLKLLNGLSGPSLEASRIVDVSHQPLNLSLNILVAVEAILNPTGDIQSFVEQILVSEAAQGLSRPQLFCELLRSCFMGQIEAQDGQDEIKWASFTFLKLPQIFKELCSRSAEPDKQRQLEMGIEKLLDYTPLLDITDTKCNFDTLGALLVELGTKYKLLSEAQVKTLMNRRQAETQRPKPAEQGSNQPSGSLILRAEPTLTSILKTLDADYSKNQDALQGVLCHMLSGKSFELILAAAAATGRLQSFAIKLIKFNEFAKQTTGEAGKAAQTRAVLFDITFLMLCHITQLYGIEVISSAPESRNSFFGQWAIRCLPEDGKYKSLELLPPPDNAKVEGLLSQFNPGGELKTSLTRWHEVCQNAPYAVQEILFAWEHGALTTDNVKSIMDNVKGTMCCLPVVVLAWLCSYINIMDESCRKKPMNMTRQLMHPVPPDPQNQFHNERSHLMVVILTKMIQEVLPPGSLRLNTPYALPPKMPAYKMLMEVYQATFSRGTMELKAIHKMEHLVNVAGPQWFCEQLVREMLSHSRPEDLNRSLSLVYGLFHIDLDALVLCLVHHTIPGLLQSTGAKLAMLNNPGGEVLAKLAVMGLTVLHKMKHVQKDDPHYAVVHAAALSTFSETHTFRRGKKRTREDIEVEEQEESLEESRPSKQRKLPISDESLSLHSEGFNFGDLLSSKEEVEVVPTYDTKDPLNKAMVNLFRLFSIVVTQSQVSQRTSFVMSFVQEAVHCGRNTARFILQFMPISMVSQLLKCLPGEFSTDLLLAVCDLASPTGRRVAAKVICQNARYQVVTAARKTVQ